MVPGGVRVDENEYPPFGYPWESNIAAVVLGQQLVNKLVHVRQLVHWTSQSQSQSPKSKSKSRSTRKARPELPVQR